MSNNSIFLVITNIDANISIANVVAINANEGTNYPTTPLTEDDSETRSQITYQMLWDSRTKERGYKRHLNGVELWVLPYLKGRVEINPLSEDITEYSYGEYLEFEKTLDPIEIESEPV